MDPCFFSTRTMGLCDSSMHCLTLLSFPAWAVQTIPFAQFVSGVQVTSERAVTSGRISKCCSMAFVQPGRGEKTSAKTAIATQQNLLSGPVWDGYHNRGRPESCSLSVSVTPAPVSGWKCSSPAPAATGIGNAWLNDAHQLWRSASPASTP